MTKILNYREIKFIDNLFDKIILTFYILSLNFSFSFHNFIYMTLAKSEDLWCYPNLAFSDVTMMCLLSTMILWWQCIFVCELRELVVKGVLFAFFVTMIFVGSYHGCCWGPITFSTTPTIKVSRAFIGSQFVFWNRFNVIVEIFHV